MAEVPVDMSGIVFKKYFQKIFTIHMILVEPTLGVLAPTTLPDPRELPMVSYRGQIFLWRQKKNIFKNISGSTGILEFALIYDEINKLLLVNILRAKVLP